MFVLLPNRHYFQQVARVIMVYAKPLKSCCAVVENMQYRSMLASLVFVLTVLILCCAIFNVV